MEKQKYTPMLDSTTSFEDLFKIVDVLDSCVVMGIGRDNVKDLINDISHVVSKASEFSHAEINVFNRDVKKFKGTPYTMFMRTPLSEIIDTYVSGFSPNELSSLDKEIKQTSYLLLNGSNRLHVKDLSLEAITETYKPIYDGLSKTEAKEDAAEKLSKMSQFGIASHLSVILYPKDNKNEPLQSGPVGYFHLTKKHAFRNQDIWSAEKIAASAATIINNYVNPPAGFWEGIKRRIFGKKE